MAFQRGFEDLDSQHLDGATSERSGSFTESPLPPSFRFRSAFSPWPLSGDRWAVQSRDSLYGSFHKWGYPQKWMVHSRTHHLFMDDLGHTISGHLYIYLRQLLYILSIDYYRLLYIYHLLLYINFHSWTIIIDCCTYLGHAVISIYNGALSSAGLLTLVKVLKHIAI